MRLAHAAGMLRSSGRGIVEWGGIFQFNLAPQKALRRLGERQKYIKDRQTPGRVHEWDGRRFVDPPSYDCTKDQEELRKTERQVSRLVSKKSKRGEARS